MQSYDKNALIQTQQSDKPIELAKAMPAKATHLVIGKMPSPGNEVTINGLVWVIEKQKRDWLRLRLKKPSTKVEATRSLEPIEE